MSNNLDLDQVADNQSSKEITINSAFGQLDAALTDILTVNVSAGNVTVDATDYLRCMALDITGAAVARNITLPASKKHSFVRNKGTAAVSLIVGSTTYVLNAGGIASIYTDGTANGLSVQLGLIGYPVPAGGSSGQVLKKTSATDGAIGWASDLTGGGGGGGAGPADPTAQHQMWRVHALTFEGGSVHWNTYEIQFREVSGTPQQATGGTPISSSDQSGFPASNAFDNSTSTLWSINSIADSPAYIGYDFGSGNQKAITQVAVYKGVSGQNAPRFKIEFSDDGSTWYTWFDQSAADYTWGAGYNLFVTNAFNNVLPPGGTTDQLLAKVSALDYDATWVNAPTGGSVPVGGSTGQVLTKVSGTDFDVDWETVTGGSGGGFPMLFDLSKGVPALSAVTAVGSSVTTSENAGIAISVSHTPATNNVLALKGFNFPLPGGSTWKAGFYILYTAPDVNWCGISFGFADSGAAHYQTVFLPKGRNDSTATFETWSALTTRASATNTNDVAVPHIGAGIWLVLEKTASNYIWSMSVDGVHTYPLQTIAIGSIYPTTIDKLFVGFDPVFEDTAAIVPVTLSILCYDNAFGSRVMGTAASGGGGGGAVTSVAGRTGAVVLDVADVSGAAPLADPTFTGTPDAPTAAVDTATTQLATTAFVINQAGASTPAMDGTGAVGTSTRYARADHVHPTDTTRAPLASPTFTGTPASVTAAVDTNTTEIATTAFVIAQASTATPIIDGTAAVGISLRYARGDHVHPTDSTRAPLASPALTGTPTAPTPTGSDNSTKIATTAFVKGLAGAANGLATLDGSGKLTTAQIPAALVGALQFQGTWNANTNTPTLASGVGVTGQFYKVSTSGSTTIDGISQWNANDLIMFDGTVWDKVDGLSSEVLSVAGRTGAVTLAVADVSGAAPLASPTFTGTPASVTAAVDTNTTQIATTAFVLAQAASATPIVDGTGAVGTSTRYARGDHVHPTDTTRAALASPTFTGTPAAPTAAVDTNTTQLASTAFVLAQAASATPLIDGTAAVGTSTRFARGDHVHPTDTTRAALASPTFTGTPAAPTATAGTNTTQLATTAFVTTAVSGLAALASPTFTGTPAAPTAAVDTNTTQIATTAFVVGQAGASTPAKATAAGAVGTSKRYARDDHVHISDAKDNWSGQPCGRIYVVTGSPTAQATLQTRIYHGPWNGDQVPGWDGTKWIMTTLAEISQLTTDTTKSPAAAVAGGVYDMLYWLDAGTWRTTRGTKWTSATSRGTGAGTAEYQYVNGLKTNKFAVTNGPGANAGLIVGTIMCNAGTADVSIDPGSVASGGGAATFGVWNQYNRIEDRFNVNDSAAGHTYQTNSYRAWNNSNGNRVNFIRGDDVDLILAWVSCQMQAAAADGFGTMDIGLDSVTTGNSLSAFGRVTTGLHKSTLRNVYADLPGLGSHFLQALERGDGTNLNTFTAREGPLLGRLRW